MVWETDRKKSLTMKSKKCTTEIVGLDNRNASEAGLENRFLKQFLGFKVFRSLGFSLFGFSRFLVRRLDTKVRPKSTRKTSHSTYLNKDKSTVIRKRMMNET